MEAFIYSYSATNHRIIIHQGARVVVHGLSTNNMPINYFLFIKMIQKSRDRTSLTKLMQTFTLSATFLALRYVMSALHFLQRAARYICLGI